MFFGHQFGDYTAAWDVAGTPVNGTVQVIVQEAGTPLPFAQVAIYFRQTMALIMRARCDQNGEFEFYGLDPTAPADDDDRKYFVIALDPKGGTRYNALIYDRVLPTV